MEIKTADIRKGVITLAVATVFGSMFYSCSTQRGLAQISTTDTLLVPKEWRPSTMALKQAQQQNKDLQKQISPLQKQLQQELPEVLTRSKKAFSEITDIKSMLDYMNNNSLMERDFLFKKAVDIRALNDSLIRSQMISNKNIEKLIEIATSERDARIANEERNMQDKIQNDAYKESTVWYASVAFGVLVLLSIISLVISFLVYRKQKYLKAHINHV